MSEAKEQADEYLRVGVGICTNADRVIRALLAELEKVEKAAHNKAIKQAVNMIENKFDVDFTTDLDILAEEIEALANYKGEDK